jgi:alkylation response protein AidB-like acyl-CoA dehydrogenase
MANGQENEAEAFRDQLRRFFAANCSAASVRAVLESGVGVDPGLWRGLADLGCLGLAVPEDCGGMGLGLAELSVLAEEAGRALAPVPLASTVYCAAQALVLAAKDAQHSDWLPRIVAGKAIAAYARCGSARFVGGFISGELLPVPDGMAADLLVIAVREGGLDRLCLVETCARGVKREPLETIDPSRGHARIVLDGAPAALLGEAASASAVEDYAAVLLAFEQTGGAARSLEMACAYARERQAFGRAIGSFQAIKHMLVDMYVALSLAQANCRRACETYALGGPAFVAAASTARISASEAYQLCARQAIQVHGGIGFTWEHECHLHYRRAFTLGLALGGRARWEERLLDARAAVRSSAAEAAPAGVVAELGEDPSLAAFRQRARQWIADNAPHHLADGLRQAAGTGIGGGLAADPVQAAKDWQACKAAGGYACLTWPREYGGAGLGGAEKVIWGQEEGVFAQLSGLFAIGHGMCGPTLMHWGSESQKRALLSPMAAGEQVWCQLFSEPSAGSDLAGLRTRAVPAADGSGDWIVSGQKVWTSGAQHCDWGLLLTRTDPAVPKHKGLTMFFVDMRSPGVEVRPIRQANGADGFNEVFFSEVRIPDSQRLGAPGEGWTVSLTTLMNERQAIGGFVSTGFTELFDYLNDQLANGQPAWRDPAIRARLASWAARDAGLRSISAEAMRALVSGAVPGPENSIGKLVAGGTKQEIAAFALDWQGERGLLVAAGQDAAQGTFQAMALRSPAMRIEGGSDEILRNVIAERVLGLPADIRVDKDIPFNRIGLRD